MNFACDSLAAATDEFLLDDTGLLLAEEEGNAIEDIRWEHERLRVAAFRWPRDAA